MIILEANHSAACAGTKETVCRTAVVPQLIQLLLQHLDIGTVRGTVRNHGITADIHLGICRCIRLVRCIRVIRIRRIRRVCTVVQRVPCLLAYIAVGIQSVIILETDDGTARAGSEDTVRCTAVITQLIQLLLQHLNIGAVCRAVGNHRITADIHLRICRGVWIVRCIRVIGIRLVRVVGVRLIRIIRRCIIVIQRLPGVLAHIAVRFQPMIALELYNGFMCSPSEHPVRCSAIISQFIQSLLELADIIALIRAIGQHRIFADIIRHIRLLLSGIRDAVSACLLYDMQRILLAVAVGCRNGDRQCRAVARGNRHAAHAADLRVGVVCLDLNIELLNRRIQFQAIVRDIGAESLGRLPVDDDGIQQIVAVHIQRRHCRRCLRHVVIYRNLEGQSTVQHLFGIGCLIGYGLCRRSLYVRHILMYVIPVAAVNHVKFVQIHGILSVPDIILRKILRAAGKRLQRIIPRALITSRCRGVGKSIIDCAVSVGRIGSDIEEIINSLKALIRTGRQYRTGNALLGQYPGR